MATNQKAWNDLTRALVLRVVEAEMELAPFNLSGRGHEARVTLGRRMA